MKNKHVALLVLVLLLIAGGLFLWLTNASKNGGASLLKGVPIAAIPSGGFQTCPSGYKYVTQWGTKGSANGQFNVPTRSAIDASGNIYVTDKDNNRVQKFNSSGAYLGELAAGQLIYPMSIAIDPSGNIYVSSKSFVVKKFNSSGVYLTQWGSFGTGNGQFNIVSDIESDAQGNIYVMDQGTGNSLSDRVQKFTSTGQFITKWGGFGTGNGQFNGAHGIDIDSSGNVYVADSNNNRVQKFSSTGVYLSQWGTYGSGNGQMFWPQDIEVDSSGNVFVVESGNNRVQKFTSSGQFISLFGAQGTANGLFKGPWDISISPNKDLYVTETGNNRVQKFSPCTPVVPSIARPDLIVEDFTWTPVSPKVRVITNPVNEPTPNTNFVIKATIKNIGPVSAVLPVGTQVSFTKGGVVYGAQQLMNSVTIPAGQTYDVTIYQSTTPNIRGVAGTFNIVVNVDDFTGGSQYSAPANRVTESNETNNSLTKSITILP